MITVSRSFFTSVPTKGEVRIECRSAAKDKSSVLEKIHKFCHQVLMMRMWGDYHIWDYSILLVNAPKPKVKVKAAQSCPTLCELVDCGPPGSSVHGFLQARTLEWVAIPFSRGSSWPRDRTWVSRIAGRFFTMGLCMSNCSGTMCIEAVFPSLYCFCTFVKDKTYLCGSISEFSNLFHW